MLQTGTWPSKPKEQINSLKALSHELSVQNGCLYFGHRIVVPASLQEAVLKQLQEGHPGMTRMKMLARGYLYWTNINRDIEEAVRHFRNCQEAAKMPKKTVLNSWTYTGPLNVVKMFYKPLIFFVDVVHDSTKPTSEAEDF
ncbi:hypothetical protein NECAME_08357 [Necator americanus]|uniref:RNA-directed DNA polymerase n=1 Tax=Necator americanus TaxID=51031 RepID=W2TJ86_NECAM|nr:hypothetical protein NECAME_08357 [Necator americanus]ETN81654.1 hypothetical protein NECAME_08357 [Necator americanus]